MKTKRLIGTEYEEKAAQYLLQKGFRILARNVFYPWGELDLIAIDESKRELVFVEVRSRKSGGMLIAEETLGKEKLKRMRRAIDTYLVSPEFLQSGSSPDGARIDLIAFEGDTVRHYPDFV